RLSAVTFDQKDIRAEAEAFVAFMEGANAGYGLDPEKTVFLGYSNGANMLVALMFLYPGVVTNAVPLRGMNALGAPPEVDLSGTNVLMLTGSTDPYGVYATDLETRLRAAGASVENRVLPAGHDIGVADFEAAKAFKQGLVG